MTLKDFVELYEHSGPCEVPGCSCCPALTAALKPRWEAESAMLAALEARREDHLSGGFCASHHGNACTCGRDRDATAIAAARAANIEPTK